MSRFSSRGMTNMLIHVDKSRPDKCKKCIFYDTLGEYCVNPNCKIQKRIELRRNRRP